VAKPGAAANPAQPAAANQQQSCLHPARAEAVQQHAQRQLEGGEGQQVGGREEPEFRRTDGKLAHKVWCHHGIHGAQQVGQKIGAGEGEERAEECAGGGRHGLFTSLAERRCWSIESLQSDS
jgi:hypothetical protein